MRRSLTTDCFACSDHSQSHRRSWQKFLHRRIYGFLVRVESGHVCGLWHRLCKAHRHALRRRRDKDLYLNVAAGTSKSRETPFWQATYFYQVGLAVAALFSLPIKPEGWKKEACLENFENKVVYVTSFTVSQKDMLESALRIAGTKEGDWSITKEPAQELFSNGIKEIQEGKCSGFPKMIARVFYPDGCGDFEHDKGTLNSLLDLPIEDSDEATKIAIERSKTTNWVDR